MIVYYTQFSKFAERYGKPCHPVLVGTGSYIYSARDRTKKWPDESKADYYSRAPEFLRDFHGLFLIDIEHLDMTDPKSAEHVKFAVAMYRVRNPGLRIGLYSILPQTSYYAPVLWEKDLYWAGERQKWIRHNQSLATGWNSLASCVDFVMPSLYEHHSGGDHTRENWIAFANAMLDEAAFYRKPVIPALWPFFSGDPGQPYVGDLRVQQMVETCKSHRAGVEGVFWWHQSDRMEPDSFYNVLRRWV